MRVALNRCTCLASLGLSFPICKVEAATAKSRDPAEKKGVLKPARLGMMHRHDYGPPARSVRTSPGSRRQPLSHLLPQGWRELHLYGPTGTGVAPQGPLMRPPPAQAPLGI